MFQAKRVPSQSRRLFAALCMVLGLLIPLTYTTVRFGQVSSSDLEFVKAERRGVVYLRPMATLIAAIADSESVAVAGRRPDPRALTKAVAAVAEADRTVGGSLRVRDSWADLQSRMAELTATPHTGRNAYRAYSEVMDVALFLMLRVGDTSKLILDPEIDSYYLMDAGMLRLPSVIADSGRMSDLEVLRGQGTGKDLPLARVLVARDRVSTAASAVKAGLAKSFGSSASSSIGKDLLVKIDAFHTALEPLAPSAPLVDQPLPPRADLMEGRRSELTRTTLELDIGALGELDQLLASRERNIEQNRFVVLMVLIAGLALATVGLVWRARASGSGRKGPRAESGSSPTWAVSSADARNEKKPEDDEPTGLQPDKVPPSGPRHGRPTGKKAAGASR
ncbi:hypothetical protein ACFVFJ_49280 [Streptomyces sp. NPDC057717]|uniref:hypothetical protein n=1 Tax=Streptomyces sp. NPDC057717 TaxID=3346224 RepID=UPI0036834ABC